MDNMKWYLQGLRKQKEIIKETLKNNPEDYKKFEMAYHQMALSYQGLNRQDVALAYYLKSQKYSELCEGEVNLFLATGYRYTGDYMYRDDELEKSLVLYKKEIWCFENSKDQSFYEDYLFNMYFKVGNIYAEIGKFSNAIYYYEKTIQLCNEEPNKEDLNFEVIYEAMDKAKEEFAKAKNKKFSSNTKKIINISKPQTIIT